MTGSQLRPYDSIEGESPTPEGSNVNYIAYHLNKAGIFCTTPGNVSSSATVIRGRQEREEGFRHLYERGEATSV